MNSNRHKPITEKRVSFGKYAGYKYSDVPTDYLKWFVKKGYGQMVNRKEWAKQELERRLLVTE